MKAMAQSRNRLVLATLVVAATIISPPLVEAKTLALTKVKSLFPINEGLSEEQLTSNGSSSAGALVLNGSNTFSGTLNLNNAANLIRTGAGTLTLNSGILLNAGSIALTSGSVNSSAATLTLSSGVFNVHPNLRTSGTLTLSSGVLSTSAITLTSNSNLVILTANPTSSGSVTLTRSGSGVLTVANNSTILTANPTSSGATLTAIGSGSFSGTSVSVANNLTIGSGTISGANSTLILAGNSTAGTGNLVLTAGTLNLTRTITGGSLTIATSEPAATDSVTPAPEPTTALLSALGLLTLASRRRRV